MSCYTLNAILDFYYNHICISINFVLYILDGPFHKVGIFTRLFNQGKARSNIDNMWIVRQVLSLLVLSVDLLYQGLQTFGEAPKRPRYLGKRLFVLFFLSGKCFGGE